MPCLARRISSFAALLGFGLLSLPYGSSALAAESAAVRALREKLARKKLAARSAHPLSAKTIPSSESLGMKANIEGSSRGFSLERLKKQLPASENTTANGLRDNILGSPARTDFLKKPETPAVTTPEAPKVTPVTEKLTPPKPKTLEGALPHLELLKDMLSQVNATRAVGRDCGGQHFPAVGRVTLDTKLSWASWDHSSDMVAKNFFDHTGSDGGSPWKRAKARGATGAHSENIYMGPGSNPKHSVTMAVNSWIKSPGHCRNLMKKASTKMGAGVVFHPQKHQQAYWTQMFGRN